MMKVDVVIDPHKEIGVIRPELHGHFLEHLGSAVYDGVWVGPESPVPNARGVRTLAIEYLRRLGIPVLRWPGGCFADTYHWRDGIGLPANRPRRINLWWGSSVETNAFGTHEFIEFCRLIGAEPYLAANIGSGTPEEIRDWLEYCNYPGGTSLSAERVENGSPDPFRVRFWGIGNESWGCGGHMTPEEYCSAYVRAATYLTPLGGTIPYLIAVGPESNDIEWSRRFFEAYWNARTYRPPLHGFAMHFYSWGKSTPTAYTDETLREQLNHFTALERAIIDQRTLIDSFPVHPQGGRVGLIVDEWGTWDLSDKEVEKQRGLFWQQNTIRDAIAAGLVLNIFHRQADKLIMCNLAQLANVLQALLLTSGTSCIRTPTYYAFLLAREHRGGRSLSVEQNFNQSGSPSVSASETTGSITITLVNPDPSLPHEVRCTVKGVDTRHLDATILHHDDMNACNTIEHPDTIIPIPWTAETEKEALTIHLPPLSIARCTLTL